ncbi:MAG: hypothetical protein M3Q10_00100 [Chloroflexota bacterium]|nr:hypothetical protein [Chloroflexota bacterium]
MTRMLQIDYDPRMDVNYRALREALLVTLRRERGLRKLAARAARLFPSTLAEAVAGDHFRWSDAQADLVRLQGDLLSALTVADIEPSWPPHVPRASSLQGSVVPPAARSAVPNRAQRRADQRRERARVLRDQGKTIKEIAAALGCSSRSVSTYLTDEQ